MPRKSEMAGVETGWSSRPANHAVGVGMVEPEYVTLRIDDNIIGVSVQTVLTCIDASTVQVH